MEQYDPVTELADVIHGVRHQKNGLSRSAKILDPVKALPLKSSVADTKNFIDNQDIGIDLGSHSKSESHVHSRRVLLHRGIYKVAQLGKLDNGFLALPDLASSQS